MAMLATLRLLDEVLLLATGRIIGYKTAPLVG